VPVAYAIGRELFDRRAGLVAALLVAASPYEVWYSQEARAYPLYALTAALSLLAFVRALDQPTARRLGWWAAASAVALLSHYYTAFLVGPEAIWLLVAHRSARRRVAAAIAPVALTGAALLPLLLAQRSTGHTTWIADIDLTSRVQNVAKRFVTGPFGTPVTALALLAYALLAAGLYLLLRRTGERARRRALIPLGLGAAFLAIPLVLALAGFDYFFDHYLIGALLPLLIVLAAGLAAEPRRVPLVAAALALLWTGMTIDVAANRSLQRDDWREVSRLLGPAPPGGRAIVVDRLGSRPLEIYRPSVRDLGPAGATVAEIDLAESYRFGDQRTPPPPAIPGFTLFDHREGPTYRLMRYRAARPTAVTPATLAPDGLAKETFFLQEP
jgi:hypothetical protein